MFSTTDTYFDDSLTFVYPPSGKRYKVPGLDGPTGLAVQRLMTIGAKIASDETVTEEDVAKVNLDDDAEVTLYERVLGTAYEPLLDETSWTYLSIVAKTVMINTAADEETALAFYRAEVGKGRRSPSDRKPKSGKKKKGNPASR